jgi:hypothetical protein
MGNMQRVGDLEIMQDLEFEHWSWRVQRIGWVVLSLIIGAACIGVLGEGPLSAATVGRNGDPLQVQYGRFVRHRGPIQMEIRLQPGAVQGDQARVWIDREYLNGVEFQNVLPEPERVEAGPDRYVFVFTLSEPANGASISFDLMPVRNGIRKVQVGLEGGPDLTFTQVVWP